MKSVSHQQIKQLFHNKFIVVLGDSNLNQIFTLPLLMLPVQRGVYKDLVLLLQQERYLHVRQLRSKGEMSFEQDCLIEGGTLKPLNNGTGYREVRQFQSAHHLVRFYFVTRIYSSYMESILEDFRQGLKPDVVVVNSCLWDISRYNPNWIGDYRENLNRFFEELNGVLPQETLVMWNLTMPLGERIKGGFLIPEIEYKVSHLRFDVIEANFYSRTLANAYGMDVLDLHYQFRFSLQHRTMDGVHWNALAHRRITTLLSQHAAQAWGVSLPLNVVEHSVTDQQTANGHATRHRGVCRVEAATNYHFPPPSNYFSITERSLTERHHSGYRNDFSGDSLSSSFLNFENAHPAMFLYDAARVCRPFYPQGYVPALRYQDRHGNGFIYRPPHHSGSYQEPHVMRSRHTRHHYAPYTQHRPSQHGRHGHYY